MTADLAISVRGLSKRYRRGKPEAMARRSAR